MDDDRLQRNLTSIGMTCFVEYFELFASPTMQRADIVEHLKSNTAYTEKSCNSRTSHAQSIIRAGRARDALKRIISTESKRVSSETRAKAEKLLGSVR